MSLQFPVVVNAKSRTALTYFRLTPRPDGCFVLSDSLLTDEAYADLVLDIFKTYTERFSIEALKYMVDWPTDEQTKLAAELNMPQCQIHGDSWLAALLFALDCLINKYKWPVKVIVSGAVRHCRGVRCVSIGRALHKARYAKDKGLTLFMPKSNIHSLNKRSIDTRHCISLPYNIYECLNIWRKYNGFAK